MQVQRVYAEARLPYALDLGDGQYGSLSLRKIEGENGDQMPYTQVSLGFNASGDDDDNERLEKATKKARSLLEETNR